MTDMSQQKVTFAYQVVERTVEWLEEYNQDTERIKRKRVEKVTPLSRRYVARDAADQFLILLGDLSGREVWVHSIAGLEGKRPKRVMRAKQSTLC